MVVGVGAVRGLFVAGFVGWYSTGIFKAMDSHYGSQFGAYLQEQLRANEHMRRDVAAERQAMDRILENKGMSLPGPARRDDAWPATTPPQVRDSGVEPRTPPAGSVPQLFSSALVSAELFSSALVSAELFSSALATAELSIQFLVQN
ncbi:Cullin-8 [Frankliniella fusca]|uniref:Cullin-8 n=1 Tax=Frankliniella fusca TaxID=407009 RepID=A0AAE1HDC2_9NEOP|nr:Cullin-8 [Frankliniella fusca]